jgi:kumamolisin
MHSFSIKALFRFLAIALVVVGTAWLVHRGPSFSFFNGGVVLSGNTPEILSESQLVKHASPETRLEIVVALKPRDEADLDSLILRQQDPNSPDYQRFLSVDQFVNLHSPTQNDVDETLRYLTSQGLKIKQVPANRLLIHAEGTISQLEKAFNVQINEYTIDTLPVVLNGVGLVPAQAPVNTYYSNDRDPSIPLHLKDVVLAVIGLDTYAQFESRLALPATAPAGVSSGAPTAPAAAPKRVWQPPHTPQDIATVYNFPNANNQNANPDSTRIYSGKGVKVAVATAYGYDLADIEGYWKKHNIVRGGKLTDRPVNGLSGKVEAETTLDLQLVSSQIPDADVLMYIAVNPSFLNFALTFNQVAVDNEVAAMTVSWGLCEKRTGWLMMKTENIVFKQLTAQGIALFVSSGDDGAYDCKVRAKDKDSKDPPGWAVDYPSSNPLFTAVGGTSLRQVVGVRTAEPAWAGSGGGISSHWSRAPWQVGKGVPTTDKRASADVALNADPNTGYSFLFKGNWSRIGGTSASAPTMASLWILTVEAAGKRVGSANPYLYKLGNSSEYNKYFHDVQTGNNGHGRGPGYPATANWDHPTGWGAPKGIELVEWMVTASPPQFKK